MRRRGVVGFLGALLILCRRKSVAVFGRLGGDFVDGCGCCEV